MTSEICLETTFIVQLLRKNQDAYKKARTLKRRSLVPVTTSITASELFHGAFRSQKNPWQKVEEVKKVLEDIEVLPLDSSNVELVGQIRATLQQRGEDIGYADSAIAGISLARGIPVLTVNVEHFRRVVVPEGKDEQKQRVLEVETW